MGDTDDDVREREVRDAPMNDDPPPRDEPRAAPSGDCKVFVGGISWNLDDYKLKDIFREFDPVDATVMIDKMTGRSRGFGFVNFKDKRDMDGAIEKLHNTEIDGRRISVSRAVPQSETAPGTPADALRRGQSYPREGGRVGGPRERAGGYGGGGGYGRSDRGGGGYDRGYYDQRGGGGYDRGYDRGGYGGGGAEAAGYGGYDSRGGYGGSDARGGYGGGGGGYDARGGYGGYDYGSYGGYGGYDQRGGGYSSGGGAAAGAYDSRGGYGGGAYDDRGGGGGGGYGAERGGGGFREPPRAGPYDRR